MEESMVVVDRELSLDEYVATAQGAADIAVQYTAHMIETGYNSYMSDESRAAKLREQTRRDKVSQKEQLLRFVVFKDGAERNAGLRILRILDARFRKRGQLSTMQQRKSDAALRS